MSLGPRIVATALVALGVTAFVAAEPPREKKHLDATLKRVINHGARLFNNGDPSGCCRVYEGALLGLRLLLAHRPELLEHVEDALDDPRPSSPECRALKLREALEEVRCALHPPMLYGRDEGRPMPHPPMPYEREDRKGKK
jgi:hypothetical protein